MSELTAGHIIAGREVSSDRTFAVLNPATGELLATVARSSAEEVRKAVDAAYAAFPAWANLAAHIREKILLDCAMELEKHSTRLTELLVAESGSCFTKARYEAEYTPRLLRAAAGEATRLYGETMPNDRPTRMSMVIREPLGVVACIVPFNAPLALLAKMTAFPLAAGNTLVVKPSEETPLIALEYAKILQTAGMPDGVINIINGFGSEIGAALTTDKRVRGIALTGSTTTGKIVGRQGIEGMRAMQLELGGSNPLIVLGDFDIEKAAEIACEGAFTHSGQICMANSRVIVERAIADQFCKAFAEIAKSIFLGELTNERTFYGTLINENAMAKCQRHIDDAVAKGGKLLAGGNAIGHNRFAPTVLFEPPRDAHVCCEETFGPVVSVFVADDLEHAIQIANETDYGLSAAILTNDIQQGMTAARQIRAGSVHVGMHPFQSNALAPIGGYGMSGIGRSGGAYSIDAFTEKKWISIETGTLPFCS